MSLEAESHGRSEVQPHEVVARPEAEYELTRAVAIVFFEKPGRGATTLARSIQRALGVPDDHFFDGGATLRERAGVTPAETAFIKRGKKIDKDIDRRQFDLMGHASPQDTVIINAKLGGYNARKFMQDNPGIEVIPVLVTCDSKIAAKRMRERKADEIDTSRKGYAQDLAEGRLNQHQYDLLLDGLDQEEEMNKSHIIRENVRDKIKKDSEQFRQLYHELEGVEDLWAPEPTLIVGYRTDPKTGEEIPIRTRLFKYQISTTHLDKEAAPKRLIELLLADGELRKVDRTKPDGDSQRQIDGGEIFNGTQAVA